MNKHRQGITIGFNILLILYSAGTGFLTFAFSDKAKGYPVQGVVLTSLIDFVRYLVMMFISAWFVNEFWNRLVTDLVPLRKLEYREAITIVVFLGILAG
ncbi:hypothetical protein [Rhodopirellula halodulae]|uniref:hypothetical protein n=1 Tax=Rhodopirellula halodulae TaxID=2894198 RepID=UPI001E4B1862|nr:hypothetical protein [Rhodopirellula sp. JC737]MCC9655125.1 hypothetical protein [Rhodopirellula sp. JC737]